jgi:hypothetical protein
VAAIVFPATIVPAPKIGEEDMEVEVRGRRLPFALEAALGRLPASPGAAPLRPARS